jgi:hypothetical protein
MRDGEWGEKRIMFETLDAPQGDVPVHGSYLIKSEE